MTTRAALCSTAAAPVLALGLATPATAAVVPSEVNLSVTSVRNAVTVTIDNASSHWLQCTGVAKRDTAPEYVYPYYMNIQPTTVGTRIIDMANGDYHAMWKCEIAEGDLGAHGQWGTPGYAIPSTHEDYAFEVGARAAGSLPFGS
ncbi:hypothetical protein O4214_08940 [Rhodococcus erythropolis]|uniref:hypothetical protein n=1 Tax=Rhodococcus erythropolis TaxID=1833 RepID=UPI001E54F240|nr:MULTISPECIES: hypothetical protein [Rhodococcus erythropolis group]MCD2105296.1 hypothetical protein [Rhodococcus qingshengii]MCZ4524100.1 hypothetical protein [Rhodococcus erythropolis]